MTLRGIGLLSPLSGPAIFSPSFQLGAEIKAIKPGLVAPGLHSPLGGGGSGRLSLSLSCWACFGPTAEEGLGGGAGRLAGRQAAPGLLLRGFLWGDPGMTSRTPLVCPKDRVSTLLPTVSAN